MMLVFCDFFLRARKQRAREQSADSVMPAYPCLDSMSPFKFDFLFLSLPQGQIFPNAAKVIQIKIFKQKWSESY